MNTTDEFLSHYGIKGMRWGVRKDVSAKNTQYKKFVDYKESVYKDSPGAIKTVVISKTGDKLTVEKEPPGFIPLSVGILTGRKPADTISTMNIRNADGKKVGSFQIWREGRDVRGEWLEIGPQYQGKGYSKAAIEGLLIAARKDPTIDKVRLQVPSNAEAAKHIYESLGFKKDKDLGSVIGYGMLEDWAADV